MLRCRLGNSAEMRLTATKWQGGSMSKHNRVAEFAAGTTTTATTTARKDGYWTTRDGRRVWVTICPTVDMAIPISLWTAVGRGHPLGNGGYHVHTPI